MKKLNLSKLIANDIVNYGMDQTLGFNYSVELDSFLKEYDEDTQEFINNNLESIIEAVEQNENVADLEYDESSKEFSMVFYYDNLMSPIEQKIVEYGRVVNKDFDLEELRHLSYELEKSKRFENLILDIIDKNKYLGIEI